MKKKAYIALLDEIYREFEEAAFKGAPKEVLPLILPTARMAFMAGGLAVTNQVLQTVDKEKEEDFRLILKVINDLMKEYIGNENAKEVYVQHMGSI